jgi:hypothetical protein
METKKNSMRDANVNIHFYRVFDWLVTTIGEGETPFYERQFFIAVTRMCNHMVHIMRTDGYQLQFYDPPNEMVITSEQILWVTTCSWAEGDAVNC